MFFHDADYRKWLLAALVIAHIAWIANHLRLVAHDQINPWKLGGYGMYTIPQPNARFQVFDKADPNTPIPVQKRGFYLAQRFTNPGRTFRCAAIGLEALRVFFEENRNLIGRDIAIVFIERRFHRTPPSTQGKMQGGVLVSWPDLNTFTYTNRFCGAKSTGSASFKE